MRLLDKTSRLIRYKDKVGEKNCKMNNQSSNKRNNQLNRIQLVQGS